MSTIGNHPNVNPANQPPANQPPHEQKKVSGKMVAHGRDVRHLNAPGSQKAGIDYEKKVTSSVDDINLKRPTTMKHELKSLNKKLEDLKDKQITIKDHLKSNTKQLNEEIDQLEKQIKTIKLEMNKLRSQFSEGLPQGEQIQKASELGHRQSQLREEMGAKLGQLVENTATPQKLRHEVRVTEHKVKDLEGKIQNKESNELPITPKETAQIKKEAHADMQKLEAGDMVLPHRTNFNTASGQEASEIAFHTATGLMAAMLEGKGDTMSRLQTGELNAKEQFAAILDTFENLLDENNPQHFDLTNQKQCDALNGLVGLLHKGFGRESGIGSFQQPGWKPAWDQFSAFASRDKRLVLAAPTGEPGNMEAMQKKNTEVLKELNEMIDFFRTNTEAQFSSDVRHPVGVDLSATQVAAVVGQLLHDFILENRLGRESQDKILNLMVENKLVNPETFRESTEVEKTMRANPLLAEIDQTQTKDTLKNAFSFNPEEGAKNELFDLISQTLMSDEEEIPSEATNNLVKDVLVKFGDAANALPRSKFLISERGRFLGDNKNVLGPDRGEKKSVVVMPDREMDKLAHKMSLKKLSTINEDKVKHFKEALDSGEILNHGASPKQILRFGLGIDTRVADFVKNPSRLMNSVLDTMIGKEGDPDKKALLESFKTKLSEDFSLQNEMKKIVEKTVIPINGAAISQKSTLAQLAGTAEENNLHTVSSIMNKHNLRTICSISGTTVDIVGGLLLSVGPEKMKEILTPLNKYALQFARTNDKPIRPLSSFEGGEVCQQMISSIAFFMQGGQYHTAGEVLGGLLIAAQSLCLNKDQQNDVQLIYKIFDGVMGEMSKNPLQFFDIPPEVNKVLQDPQMNEANAKKLEKAAGERAKENRQAQREYVPAKKTLS